MMGCALLYLLYSYDGVRSPNLIAEVCIKGKWRKLFRLEQTKTPHSRPGGEGGGQYHQFFIKQIKRRQGYLETSDEVNQKLIEEIHNIKKQK